MHSTVSGIAPPSGKFTPYVAYQSNQSSSNSQGGVVSPVTDATLKGDDMDDNHRFSNEGRSPSLSPDNSAQKVAGFNSTQRLSGGYTDSTEHLHKAMLLLSSSGPSYGTIPANGQ